MRTIQRRCQANHLRADGRLRIVQVDHAPQLRRALGAGVALASSLKIGHIGLIVAFAQRLHDNGSLP